ncbi:hypothetical protein Gotri_014659 [Gossypium trilobum]|uniref:Uncharacterized protein n=1 Tax=Gossypium trilobum TaxID=34281 RepID=A0A7J9DY76_9ROSI|nr:hypothetical protein [Gossypium trilobum]
MGKASNDRHLALFAFTVYGLIVFLKALGYVSVELANFLFQIEKGLLFVWMKVILGASISASVRCLFFGPGL